MCIRDSDPFMSLVIELNQNIDDLSLRNGAERCVRLYAEDAKTIKPGEIIPKANQYTKTMKTKVQKKIIILPGI